MKDITDTLGRLKAAANAVASRRNAWMWSEDMVQECALMMLDGHNRVRLDRKGLTWLMHGLLDVWLGSRRKLSTVVATAKEMTRAPTIPSDFCELKEIYELATPAERRALFVLATEGYYRMDGASKKERMRDSAALYSLRKKIK